ncbi:hypothetical protein B0H13DRAFT_2447204 [Mycena leptocephala]|nr:hypothetical protein B0H13DRAFT_2447204 [Mycena leptocephala]
MAPNAPAAPKPVTRAKNKDSHPGFDTGHRKPWIVRRTHAEVVAAQEKEESDKHQAAEEQKRLTKKVAEIEDRQREEDLQNAARANHPVDASPPADLDEEGDEHDDASFNDEGDGEDSDSSEEDEPEQPRGRQKVVKTSRDNITAQRRTKAQSGTPEIGPSLKRKASEKEKKTGAKKKSKLSKKSGLAPAPRRTASSASGRSSQMAVDTDDDGQMVRPGGPAFDDDPNEHIEGKQKKKKRGRPSESDYIQISKPPKPPTLKEIRQGRDKWTLDDFPSGASAKFKEVMTPLARVHMGQHEDPWEVFTDEQLEVVMDKIYGEHDYNVKDPVWHGLVAYRLTDWRNAIAHRGLDAVTSFLNTKREDQIEKEAEETQAADEEIHDDPEDPAFNRDGSFNYTTREGIAAFVEYCLQEENHTAPYHWREWNNGVQKEGLFENDVILWTLAHHVMIMVNLPLNVYADSDYEHPIGALILCIQAVERALRAWSTGEFVMSSKSADHFSKDHYADTIKMVKGLQKKHKRSGKYVPTIRNFNDKQWESIFEITETWVDRKKKGGSSRSSSMDVDRIEIESDEDEHFVLTADAPRTSAES